MKDNTYYNFNGINGDVIKIKEIKPSDIIVTSIRIGMKYPKVSKEERDFLFFMELTRRIITIDGRELETIEDVDNIPVKDFGKIQEIVNNQMESIKI